MAERSLLSPNKTDFTLWLIFSLGPNVGLGDSEMISVRASDSRNLYQ